MKLTAGELATSTRWRLPNEAQSCEKRRDLFDANIGSETQRDTPGSNPPHCPLAGCRARALLACDYCIPLLL
jgi:hypothetical protein